MTQRALVLGGHGFIGKHLVESLKTCGFSVDAPTHKELDIRYMTGCDVTGYHRCYNLASTTHNYHILSDPYLDIDVNCNGAVSLLEEFRKHNLTCLQIYVSTFFVNWGYPKGLYGATKYCAENIYQTYNRVFNIPFCIMRLPNVYGPGEQGGPKKGSLNWMIEQTVNGQTPIHFYAGNAKREFLYITDAVFELIECAHSEFTFNIPGYSMRMGEFIKLIDPTAIEVDSPEFHKQVGITHYSSEADFVGKVLPAEGIERTRRYYEQIKSVYSV